MALIPSRQPWGYLQTDRVISDADAQRIQKLWAEAMERGGAIPILGAGVRFVEFTPQRTPKAICLYCGSANLTTSIECAHCGAGLLE